MTITEKFRQFVDALDFIVYQGPFNVYILEGFSYTTKDAKDDFTTFPESLKTIPEDLTAAKKVIVYLLNKSLAIYEERIPMNSNPAEYVRYLNGRWLRWVMEDAI